MYPDAPRSRPTTWSRPAHFGHAADGIISNMPSAFDSAPAADAVTFRLLRAVVDTPATIEDYQKLSEIVHGAQENNLAPEQIAAQIDGTPFAWLIHMLPENKDQAYSFVQALSSILAVIIALVALNQKPEAPIILTPTQEKHIIEQLNDQKRPATPAPTDIPARKEPPNTGCP